MGRIKEVLSDKTQTSTIKKLGRQTQEPTEEQMHEAFMKDYTKEYENFKEAVMTSWKAQNE